MKKAIILTLFYLLCFFHNDAQMIPPPAGFKLLKADGVTRQIDHYVKGGYTFMRDDWMGPPPANAFKYDTAVAKYLSENYRTSLGKDVHFIHDVYYGTAHYSDNYVFIVLCGGTVYKCSSKKQDAGFKKYTNWLLTQAIALDRD